jgi:hypothetical protein
MHCQLLLLLLLLLGCGQLLSAALMQLGQNGMCVGQVGVGVHLHSKIHSQQNHTCQ